METEFNHRWTRIDTNLELSASCLTFVSFASFARSHSRKMSREGEEGAKGEFGGVLVDKGYGADSPTSPQARKTQSTDIVHTNTGEVKVTPSTSDMRISIR
jgi:hypothetical protein